MVSVTVAQQEKSKHEVLPHEKTCHDKKQDAFM
jgi:hypothetical protein